MLESGMEYPLLSEMANLIDRRDVKMIMTQMRLPTSVENIIDAHNETAWQRRYLLLWMLKYGMLGFVKDNDIRKDS